MKTREALVAVLTVLALIIVARFAHYGYELLCYPYPWEIREALSLHHGLILARGQILYRLSTEPPQIIPAYGPLFPAVMAPFLQADHPSFFVPRLISLLSVGSVLSSVAVVAATLSRSWRWGVIAVGVALLQMDWWRWLLLGRPDSLGLLLAFSALLVHARWPRSSLALAGCAILLVLAFLTKVTTLVVAFSISASLAVLYHDLRRALWFALGLSAALMSAFALTNALTDGLYGTFSFKMVNLWTHYSGAFMTTNALWLCARYLPVWLVLALPGRRWTLTPGLRGVLAVHLLVATPVTALLLLNTGGYAYYWYGVLPAAAILACAVLAAETGNPGSRLALAALVIMAVWLARGAGWSAAIPSQALANDWKALESVVDGVDGPVMNDDATTILNLWNHKDLYSEGVGYVRNAAWLKKTYGLKVQDAEVRLRTHYYKLLLNPEDRALAERYYAKVGSYEIPVQLGRPHTIDVFAPRNP